MIRQLICRLKKGERGAALIEFALAILILPVLVIGIIEFGWILTGYITVTGAAREGARVAVVGGDYEQAVYNHTASMPALSVTQLSILPKDKGAETTVTVTGSLNTFTGFFNFLGKSTSFTSAATMRQEKYLTASPGPSPTSPPIPTVTISDNDRHLNVSNVLNNATVYLYRADGTLIDTETTNHNQTSVTFNNAANNYKGETLLFRQKITIDGEDVYSDYGSIFIPN